MGKEFQIHVVVKITLFENKLIHLFLNCVTTDVIIQSSLTEHLLQARDCAKHLKALSNFILINEIIILVK